MKRIIVFFSLTAMLAASIFAYYQYNKTHTQLTNVKADFAIKAIDLYSAFSEDENSSNTLYIDKVLDISGIVSNIATEETSSKIFLATDDIMGEVQCEMDVAADITGLQVGDEVNIRGVCSGFLTDVVINRCVIIK